MNDIDLIISAATQRSGSTLMQRVFNSRTKTMIWGEHNGVMTEFSAIHSKTIKFFESHKGVRAQYFNNNENTNNWIANLLPDKKFINNSIINSVKTYFNTLYAERRTNYDMVGFKEVRYGKGELQLLRRCYPNTPIILLIRNPVTTAESLYGTMWGKNALPLNMFIEKWNKNVAYYNELAKVDSNTYLIKYEDLISKNPKTLQILSRLGRLTNQHIEKVISVKINSTSKRAPNFNKQKILQRCRHVMKQVGY